MDTLSLPDRLKPPKAQKQKPPKQPKPANPPKAKRQETVKPAPDDPQMMFKVGFLSDVYQERSIESGTINKVITRVGLIAQRPQARRPNIADPPTVPSWAQWLST
ncbi:MAG: hypothetical protein Q9192_009015, partial [Flavoplaca navasiana]